jgi:hypothetical protein
VQKKARNPGPFFDTRETTQAPAPFWNAAAPKKERKKSKKKEKKETQKK